MKRRIAELWATLMLDPKRTGVLGILMLGLMFSVGRMVFKAGPSRVSAGESMIDTSGIPGMEKTIGAVTLDDLKRGGPAIDVDRPAPISRNLFVFDRSYFPEPPQKETTVQVAPKSPLGTDDTSESDDRSAYERLVEQVRTQSERLRLRSTMLGARPVAVIELTGSGEEQAPELVRPGESIAGFEVVQVRAHSVLLSKDGVMIELQHEKPEH